MSTTTIPTAATIAGLLDTPGAAPDRRVARLWVKTIKQSEAAATLAARYGDEALQTRAAKFADTSRQARASYLDATTADTSALWFGLLGSISGSLRTLLVELHMTAGHYGSVPEADRPTAGEQETSSCPA